MSPAPDPGLSTPVSMNSLLSRGLGPPVLLLLLATSLPADNIQSARDMIFAKRYEDARTYIDRELTLNPESWQALKLRGDLIFYGLEKPRDALAVYRKSWSLSGGRDNVSGKEDAKDHEDLGAKLNDIYLQLAREAFNKNGLPSLVNLLEKVISEHRFYSLPIVVELFKAYQQAGELGRITKLIEQLPDPDAGLEYRTDTIHWGHVFLYSGRAALAEGQHQRAYDEFKKARRYRADVPDREFAPILERMKGEVETKLFEAKKAYRDGEYPKVLTILAPIRNSVPSELGTIASEITEVLENSQVAVEFEAVGKRVDEMVAAGKFGDAIPLLENTLRHSTNDELLVSLKEKLDQKRLEILKKANDARQAREKADDDMEARYHKALSDARVLLEKGKYPDAVKAFEEALALHSTESIRGELEQAKEKASVQEGFQKGEDAFKAQKYTVAVQELEGLEKKDFSYKKYEAQRMLALSFFALKQNEKGEAHALKALDIKDDGKLLLALADYYKSRGDTRFDRKKEYEFLQKYLKIDPDSADVRKRAGEVYWAIHQLEFFALGALILAYVFGFIFTKKRPQIMKTLGMAELERLMSKGAWAQAADLHERLMKLPMDAKEEIIARTHFQKAFFESGQYGRSVSEAQLVLRAQPENKQMRIMHAKCLYRMKNISSESLKYYFDLIDSEGQNKELMVFVGNFCTRKKILNPETLQLLRTVAEMTPEDDALRSLLIKGYMKENDLSARAIKLYEIEREKNPNNVEVRVALAEYYLKKGNLTKTIEECEELINLDLNNRRIHQVLIKAYERLGKTGELVEIYRSILAADPHNAVVQQMLAVVAPGEGRPAPVSSQRPAINAEGGGVSCPKCGSAVGVGQYFCSCGQHL